MYHIIPSWILTNSHSEKKTVAKLVFSRKKSFLCCAVIIVIYLRLLVTYIVYFVFPVSATTAKRFLSLSDNQYLYVFKGPGIGGGEDGSSLQLTSTCHLALDACERDGICNRFLDQIKRNCDSVICDRQKCMRSLHDFYENIHEKHSLDIAFCICKWVYPSSQNMSRNLMYKTSTGKHILA